MPLRCGWPRLEAEYQSKVTEESSQRTYASDDHREQDVAFWRGRFGEGRAVAAFLEEQYPETPLRILDIGSGNGAVATAVANHVGYSVVALEYAFVRGWVTTRANTGISVAHITGNAMQLPFGAETFDVALCLETLEHVPRAAELATEIMRILKPGGICIVTTPARLRFLLRRDPHFAIPGLLLLPDRAQKWIVTQVTRRIPAAAYDVHHMYFYAGSILRLFPGRRTLQAIGAPPAGPLARRLWSLSQRFLWQRLVIKKQTQQSAENCL